MERHSRHWRNRKSTVDNDTQREALQYNDNYSYSKCESLFYFTPSRYPLKRIVLQPGTKVMAVAWCIIFNMGVFSPILVFSAYSVLYYYNLETGSFHGVTRGHGGVSFSHYHSNITKLIFRRR